MNTVLLDTSTYKEAETFAKLNNVDVTEVVKASVLNFLRKFNSSERATVNSKYELPGHLKKMRGVLAGVD